MRPRPVKTMVALGILAGAGCAVRRFGRRSGATAEEALRPLPGDDIVSLPLWESTRAITIQAPAPAVWPWVVQMGYPTFRAGWYTPHWLDQLMWGERPRSADEIRADLQDLQVGDKVPDSADFVMYYNVEEVEPPSHLVLHSASHIFPPIKSVDFSWVFVLVPLSEQSTRLFVRARVEYAPRWAYPLVEPMLDVGDFVNVSVMLRGIRRRAQRGRL
jgi:hypothetical protein